jgi:hypothetical protein
VVSLHLEALYLFHALPPPLQHNPEAIAEAAAEGMATRFPLEGGTEGGTVGGVEDGVEDGRESGREGKDRALPVLYTTPFPFLWKSVSPSRLAEAPVVLGAFVDAPKEGEEGGREGGREGGVLTIPGNEESRRAVLVVHILEEVEREEEPR